MRKSKTFQEKPSLFFISKDNIFFFEIAGLIAPGHFKIEILATWDHFLVLELDASGDECFLTILTF